MANGRKGGGKAEEGSTIGGNGNALMVASDGDCVQHLTCIILPKNYLTGFGSSLSLL